MKRTIVKPAKPAPIRKERTILFSKFPPGQVPEAADELGKMGGLDIKPRNEERAIDVAYDLHEHSLEELEGHLEHKGFHLDNTLMSKLMRALVYYIEETQLHNLEAPERIRGKSQSEAYTNAWERHPHGDHDDTPPEWRDYK